MHAKLIQIALSRAVRALGMRPASSARRGSFLILVVGILALLSVIAVLYATIGAADRTRGAALVRADQSDAVPAAMRDYIAGIVGDSALGVFPEGMSNGDYKFLRQTWDYPWMDWTARSDRNNGTGNLQIAQFNPTGTPRQPAALYSSNQAIIWRPSSPWLASVEPTTLHPEANSNPEYTNRRDWLKISNISPDGYFGNLADLRGRFLTGYGPSGNGLRLLDDRGNPATRTDWGYTLQGDDSNYPAYWTQRQRGAFAPLGYNPRNLPWSNPGLMSNQWGDADGDGMYDSRWTALDASWGDAFGFLARDTRYRWYAAVRIIDASALLNVNFAMDQAPWQPVDAGGSPVGPTVNPTPDRPVGCSPAEIDLRRALTMRDAYDQWNLGTSSAQSRGFDHALNVPGVVPDYTDYDRVAAGEIGHWAYISLRLALGTGVTPPRYNTLDSTPTSPRFAGSDLWTFAQRVGVSDDLSARLWNFEVLDGRIAEFEGLTAPEARLRLYTSRAAADNASAWSRVSVTAPPATAGNPPEIQTRVYRENQGWFGVEDAIELFTYRGLNNPERLSPLEATLGGRDNPSPTSRPSHPDYSPLLDNVPGAALRLTADVLGSGAVAAEPHWLFHAINVRQRLTPYSGARELYTNATIDKATTDRLSTEEIRLDAPALLAAADKAPVLRAMDDRHRTDESFNAIFEGYLRALAPSIADGNGDGLMRPATAASRSLCWQDNNAGTPSPARTLCYGHQGPELAYYLSAFLSVNVLSGYQSDVARVTDPADPRGLGRVVRTIPQARTVLVSDPFRRSLYTTDATMAAEGRQFPWWHVGKDIDPNPRDGRIQNRPKPDPTFKMADTGDDINAQAINVYGNAPQPFITSVAGFTVYTDARFGAASNGFQGTDDEVGAGGTDATINGTIGYGNRDMLMRVFAVQLTNPYNVAIQLGSHELDPSYEAPAGPRMRDIDPGNAALHPGFDRMKDYFYLDFAGRTYALVQLQEQHDYAFTTNPTTPTDLLARPIVIPAGESVVVYATSTLPRDIMVNRVAWLDAAHATAPYADPWFGATDIAHSPYQFHQLIRKHIADRAHGIGRWTTGAAREDGLYLIPEIYSPRTFPTAAADIDRLGQMSWSRWDSVGNARVTTQFASAGLASFSDLFDPYDAADPTKTRVVKLWRALRCGRDPNNAAVPDVALTGDDQTGPGAFYVHNLRSNDLLVDRFRLPSTPLNASNMPTNPDYYTNLDQRLPAGNNPITSGDPGSGLTITLWDSAHRPSDPLGGDPTVAVPVGNGVFSGMLPSYCLERKLAQTPGSTIRCWNAPAPASNADANPTTFRFQSVGATGLNVPDGGIFTSVPGANEEFWDWYRGTTLTATRTAVIPAVAIAPSQRHQGQNPDPVATYPDHDWSIDGARWRNANFAGGIIKPPFVNDRPEIAVDADNFTPHVDIPRIDNSTGTPVTIFDHNPIGQSYLRSTDMLSTLAVCAFQDPAYGPASTLPLGNWNNLLTLEDAEWTTLSEALALAMGYERAPRPSVSMACRTLYPINSTDPNDLYNPAGGRRPLFDRGCLRLDDFVPYNRSSNASDPHLARGTQIPLAWNVLDVFRVRDTRGPKAGTPLDPRDPPIKHGVAGVLNVNTAPLENQRMVPLLTPPLAETDPVLGWGAGRAAWWWAADLSKGGLSPASDIAATIVALRDKVGRANYRPQSDPGVDVTFRERNGATEQPPFDGAGNPANAYDVLLGRQTTTQIPDLGEFPGFRSPAAILAARFQDPTDPLTKALPCNIDHFGFNVTQSGTPSPCENSKDGVTPHTFRVWDVTHTPSPAWVNWTNRTPNDYGEKLAVAAGAMGSISTRSDVFVAWFLLHGYQRSDVEGLGPNDPMVPTIKRRFMMVLDRSNVLQRGDRPKVLVFQEVPVD